MRIAVLAAADSWYLSDLRRAAEGRHEIAAVGFRELAANVSQQGEHILAGRGNLNEFSVLLVRTMPPGSLEQVVFRMDVLARLEAQGVRVLNPPRAIEAAVDKYLTTARLAAAGLPVPRTIVCETAETALAAFHTLGGDVVVKPIFGSEGRGIARVQDEAIAGRTFRTLAQLGCVLYLQEFIPHEGFDLRVLVIGEKLFADPPQQSARLANERQSRRHGRALRANRGSCAARATSRRRHRSPNRGRRPAARQRWPIIRD